MAYSMAHLAAGSLCLLEPSGHARAGSGVTTSVSASVLVLGFLSAPRTLNGVAMVDRPHYHPHAPLLLTANLVFFGVVRVVCALCVVKSQIQTPGPFHLKFKI